MPAHALGKDKQDVYVMSIISIVNIGGGGGKMSVRIIKEKKNKAKTVSHGVGG